MVGFPLLLIPLAIYNIIAFLMRDVSFVAPLVSLPLPSGTGWPVTLSDILLTLGILLLLCEIVKGARPGAKYLTDHLLSLVVLCGAGAEFAMLPPFGTSTYFLLTVLALADFLSGIALRARRGMPVASGTAVARRSARKPEMAAASEPRFDPPPEPSIPLEAPAAVAVLPDHPQPDIAHPEIAPIEPSSPEVPSPGLQPGSGSTPPDAPPR